MPIKYPEFATVARRKSNPAYTLEDVHHMEEYKRNLVIYFLYGDYPSNNGIELTQAKKDALFEEIKRTETWTKKETENIINKSITL